jgi:hypothetical protein
MIEQVQALPEADQQRVLRFVASISSSTAAGAQTDENIDQFLVRKDGLLVFTGEILGAPQDWLQIVREERENEILAACGFK